MNLCMFRLKTPQIIKESFQRASRGKLLNEVQLMVKSQTKMTHQPIQKHQ